MADRLPSGPRSLREEESHTCLPIPFEDESASYSVLVNGENQQSLWPGRGCWSRCSAGPETLKDSRTAL
ncbi:MbtH family NRPS accessory protein [Streptomyces sp. NRRL S-448]|uniref:MbtH family NRPS accessory protein n=1 Tax=Streptomyces sp. NRRL S-448 TaxID=1463907 RepID=UPI003563A81D